MYKITSRFVVGLFAVFLFAVTANADSYFTGNLNGAQETPPNASTALGFGRVTLNAAENQITASVYYGNPTPLGSNVTIGHIHRGAVGVAGPVVFDLMPTAGVTSGQVVNMTFAVTPAQVADLKAGLYYFNIHTVNFGAGEIRGQITVDSPYLAYADKNQENPPTTSSATGNAAVSINAAGTQAIATFAWAGISGNPTGAHIHNGRSRINGPVICGFTPPAATTGAVVDALCNFTPAQITALRTGQLYVNVHTSANPGGEIRGQLQRRRSTVLDFDGDSKTDYILARNNTVSGNIEWWVANSSGGVNVFPFGASAEFAVTTNPSRLMGCDYDNDGKDDPMIWRSAAAPSAGFVILASATNTAVFEQIGTTGDHPTTVYDYDGDGRCDPAVYRSSPSPATWFYRGTLNNAAGAITYVQFGSGSFPSTGDYNGDGRGDFMVQSGANWWTLFNGSFQSTVVTFGTSLLFQTPGDYDGDGKTDNAGTLSEGGQFAWYYVSSLNPSQDPYLTRKAWGPTSGFRAQGDYDGDGRSDYAVWVEGTVPGFWVLPSNGSASTFFQWGQVATPDDYPVAEYNNR